MLTYILWHWPFLEVNAERYEINLADFHRSLAASNIPGFRESVEFRNSDVPWAGLDQRSYEDWYLLDGSAAMNELNEAAVSAASKLFHDNAARGTAGAAAGLYRLQAGQPNATDCRFATWLAKPQGIGYEDFYASVQTWTSQAGVCLWRRQMVLGPTPEFGMFSTNRLRLPSSLAAVSVELELVWK